MEVQEIRKLVSVRPFRPFVFHLDNGQSRPTTHPEIIITDTIVVAVDDEGEAVYLAPEAISSISYQKYKKANPSRRKKIL